MLTWGCVGAIVAGFVLAPGLGSGIAGGDVRVPGVRAVRDGVRLRPARRVAARAVPGAGALHRASSLAFNLAGIIGGGLTPVAAQALATRGGLALVGVYLAAMAGMSLVALLAMRRSADRTV